MAEPAQRIGDYLILELIAQGGMAQIYKARTSDPNGIGRLVVIKRILPHISSDPEYIEMLIDEAKIAVHFTHGNIAQIYDLGKVGDDYFIVMEYVDGKTLGQILREFKEREIHIPLEIIVYCMIEVCHGLDYMHQKTDVEGNPLGVVHRDISPQNIIVSYSGTVKIIDFGVAKAMHKAGHTESGVLKGKFAYMSPEQAAGDPTDRRSDIFSAGTLLWELLTRERLFKRSSNRETIKAIRRTAHKPPSKIRIDVPRDLDVIVGRALEKKRGRRYQNASEMAADLGRFLIDYKPDFKPVHVAQFLYRYFGPEADEEGLPPELPELAVSKEPKKPVSPERKIALEEEEKTELDKVSPGFLSHLVKNKVLCYVSGAAILFTVAAWAAFHFIPPFFWGTINIEVKPSNAELFVNDKQTGKGSSSYKIEYRSGRPVKLEVKLKDYHPYQSTFKLQGKEVRDLSVVLEKKIPPYGSVYVESNPPGAVIYLDDMEWNQPTPAKIPHLSHNKEYRIGLFLEGHQFAEQKTKIIGGRTNKLLFGLEIDYAAVEINSSPPGANVIIDGQVVGKTPFVNRRLKPGEPFEFDLELEGYKGVSDSLELKPGEKKVLSIELKE